MSCRLQLIALASLGVLSAALAAPPSMNDYAKGVTITSPAGRPLVETPLPDLAYKTVTRADLGDLRVFNADGVPVPHALCPAPEAGQPTISDQMLPVFELRDARARAGDGTRVEVQTAGGAQVNVQEPVVPDASSNGHTHIIDARGNDEPLRAIQFNWRSPDGASEVKVSIQASEDLDRWTVLVPSSTLLLATSGGQELKRERIEVPTQAYKYLRVQRVDKGPPLAIDSVFAERVRAAPEAEPFWFMPTQIATNDSDPMLFVTGRRAPITYARMRLPQENSSVTIALQSRDNEKAAWQERWRGEVYLIATDTQRRESPPPHFAATTDPFWRMQILKNPQVYRATVLEFGYRPARLRFLAQGPGPYTLAFGSKRAEVIPPAPCNALLADVTEQDREQMTGEGALQDPHVLGGDAAFKPLPKRTPVRLVVLWSVLIVGVALLVAMALSLLKRLR